MIFGFGLVAELAILIAIAGSIATVAIGVGESAMRAKLFAIGLGIAIFLPLSVHYGVYLFSPPPKWDDYHVANYEVRREAATKQERVKLAEEQSRLEKQRQQAEKRHQQHVFVAAYPAGLLALIVGALVTVPGVSAGLMFGGIFTLADGCYSYWDIMAPWLRFLSLLVVLVALVVLGCWRLGPAARSEPEPGS